MPWWWSKRETGSPYEDADRLYDECVSLSHVPGSERAALLKARETIAALRPLLERTGSLEAKRRLGKALWRQSALLAMQTPSKALEPGRQGVALAREVLAATSATHASFEAVLREFVIAMNDLAQAAARAGDLTEREALLLEARKYAEQSRGPAARQALATTLYNLAHHKLQRVVEHTQAAGAVTIADRNDVLELATAAVHIRTELCDRPTVESYQRWELANAQGLLGRALVLLGHATERERGLEILARAPDAIRTLNHTADSLRQELAETLAELQKVYIEYSKLTSDTDVLGKSVRGLSPYSACLLELVCLLTREDRTDVLLRLWYPDRLRLVGLPTTGLSFDAALSELKQRNLVKPTACCQRVEVSMVLATWVVNNVSAQQREYFARERAQLWLDRFLADAAERMPAAVRAGIACSVYATRIHAYDRAYALLEQNVLDVACQTGETEGVLSQMQSVAAQSGTSELSERCDGKARWLARAHLEEGLPEAALATADCGLAFAEQYRLGAVSIATWQVERLEYLLALGRHAVVLERLPDVLECVERAQALQDCRELSEHALHIAAGAAKGLQDWQCALDLNARVLQSMQTRGASAAELARARTWDCASLMELGDLDASDELLRTCEGELRDDPIMLAVILGERGALASKRGDKRTALRLKRTSLQLHYAQQSRHEIALAHEAYGNALAHSQAHLLESGAHWLAAAVLLKLSGDNPAVLRLRERFASAKSAILPGDYQELIKWTRRTPNAPLDQLLAQSRLPVQPLVQEVIALLRTREPAQ